MKMSLKNGRLLRGCLPLRHNTFNIGKMKHIVIMTGAGISAESGIKTFRDADGLWEGHDVMQVATPEGWAKNRELVLKFYNDRRRQLLDVQPNAAHKAIAALQEKFKVTVITPRYG